MRSRCQAALGDFQTGWGAVFGKFNIFGNGTCFYRFHFPVNKHAGRQEPRTVRFRPKWQQAVGHEAALALADMPVFRECAGNGQKIGQVLVMDKMLNLMNQRLIRRDGVNVRRPGAAAGKNPRGMGKPAAENGRGPVGFFLDFKGFHIML